LEGRDVSPFLKIALFQLEGYLLCCNDLLNIILDPNKATGPDKISHKMLKISPEKITKPLVIIFNKSLQQSKYPSNWKSAIFKKGDTSLPSLP
jgi:hypothetical protein